VEPEWGQYRFGKEPEQGTVERESGGFRYTAPSASFTGYDTVIVEASGYTERPPRQPYVFRIARNRDLALSFREPDSRAYRDYQLPVSNFTFEAWIYPEGWGAYPYFQYGTIIDSWGFLVFLNDWDPNLNERSLCLVFYSDDGVVTAASTPNRSIRLNAWQHVAFTFDNRGSVKALINGELQSLTWAADDEGRRRRPDGRLASRLSRMTIGNNEFEDSAFHGLIGDVRLWNHVRLPSLIANLRDPVTFEETSGLLLWLPFDEGQGSSAYGSDANPIRLSLTKTEWAIGPGEKAPPGHPEFAAYLADQGLPATAPFAAFAEDPDNDGVPTGLEFATGWDAMDPAAKPAPLRVTVDGDGRHFLELPRVLTTRSPVALQMLTPDGWRPMREGLDYAPLSGDAGSRLERLELLYPAEAKGYYRLKLALVEP
jgi:hypothetical protein